MADTLLLVYTTLPGIEAAEALGRHLVETRLAACVNIIPHMRAIYRWEGRIEQADETAMIVKTARSTLDALLAEAKARHPYDVPALIVIEPAHTDAAYLDWACAGLARTSDRAI